MKRFCYRCGDPITDEKRIMRGAVYCSTDCRKKAANELRGKKAGTHCRRCGRRFKKSPKKAAVSPSATNVCAESAQGCKSQQSLSSELTQ